MLIFLNLSFLLIIHLPLVIKIYISIKGKQESKKNLSSQEKSFDIYARLLGS